MKMDEVASSGNDEFYTPSEAVTPLVPYLKARGFRSVWCPFDSERSQFVKVLTAAGFEVSRSHIADGVDFFDHDTDDDVIVSNPPYSKKNEVFEHLFSIGRPFAMLVGVVGLFESKRRFNLFSNNKFEVLYFDKRISYFKSYDDARPALHPPFSSVYLTSGILPKQVCFEKYTGPR